MKEGARAPEIQCHHLSPPVTPVLQRRFGEVPQSGRAEASGPPAPMAPAAAPPEAEASMTFHVNTARLSRAGDEWQVGRRDLEVRGRQLELGDEPECASVEGPRHRVRLEGFLMGQTTVTQAQWRVVAEPPRGLAPQAIR